MKKLFIIIIIVTAMIIWYGFQGKIVSATKGSVYNSDLPPTNFSGANLTGATLGGVNLDGVILSGTTTPDGSINNSSCKN